MVLNIRKAGALIFFSSFICLASSGKSLNGNQINNGSTLKSSVSLLTAPTIVIDHVGLNTIDTLPDYIPPYSEVLVDVIVNGGVDDAEAACRSDGQRRPFWCIVGLEGSVADGDG